MPDCPPIEFVIFGNEGLYAKEIDEIEEIVLREASLNPFDGIVKKLDKLMPKSRKFNRLSFAGTEGSQILLSSRDTAMGGPPTNRTYQRKTVEEMSKERIDVRISPNPQSLLCLGDETERSKGRKYDICSLTTKEKKLKRIHKVNEALSQISDCLGIKKRKIVAERLERFINVVENKLSKNLMESVAALKNIYEFGDRRKVKYAGGRVNVLSYQSMHMRIIKNAPQAAEILEPILNKMFRRLALKSVRRWVRLNTLRGRAIQRLKKKVIGGWLSAAKDVRSERDAQRGLLLLLKMDTLAMLLKSSAFRAIRFY